MSFNKLKGMVTLVTGGASGLGLATTKRFAEQGAKVVMCDLPTSSGEEISKELGENVIFHPCDVTSESDVSDGIDIIKKNWNKLDCVVNCAGVGIAIATYTPARGFIHPQSEFERILRTNVGGTFNVIRQASKFMHGNEPDEDGHRGVIINTASVAAFDGQRGQAAYSASKGAIVAMTLPIARDLNKIGVRVNAIAPGLFATPLLSRLPEKVVNYLEQLVVFPQRFGKPEEFAHLAQSITENKMVNGEVIRLDGGLRMPP